MTKKQADQFNKMAVTLHSIARHYATPAKLRRIAKSSMGLDYSEALEMSYENIQQAAASASKGVKLIKTVK